MNDAPGWASPGSSGDREPRGEDRDRDEQRPPSGDTAQPSGDAPPPPGGRPPTGWAAQQPPPQGWNAPGGPPPTYPGGPAQMGAPGHHGQYGQHDQYGGGYGQQPGGWGGGWHPPQAAKPGVIPLRPLGVGEILDGAISTMRAHWRPVLGIALGVAVVIQLVTTVLTRLWFSDQQALVELQNDPTPSMDQVSDALTQTAASSGVGGLATLVGTVIATAMLTMVVSRAVLGRPVTMGEAWHDARPRLLRLLGLTVLVTLILVSTMLVCVLPGVLLGGAGGAFLALLGGLGGLVLVVWLWIRFTLSAPALMLERSGVLTALQRSARLVRGSWWRIFGIQLLAALIVAVLGFVISIPTSLIAGAVSGASTGPFGAPTELTWSYLIVLGIGSVLTSTITLPFNAGVTALLYIDARIRREGLDLELARAAGAHGHAPGRPGTGAQGH
ncbi:MULTISPECIES: DUF7544 domain-containing protein [Streptomyces]|uniref:DUF7544 domain-containing protein n=1 Tax=Streptomyces TaxID=1883 RepID=UPI0022497C3D|nr:hypothetical protein [Streptomyces sp. JHD 1]MCX2970808.1 hypothetical protein [Streptomyces sp. JHD 1]